MKVITLITISLFSIFSYAAPTSATFVAEKQAQEAMYYFLDQVELDPLLTHEEQHEKIDEFKIFADQLSCETAFLLIHLLLEESRIRVIEMYQHAALDEFEMQSSLAEFDSAVQSYQNMDVESARQILFFVAELKLHRAYVFEFGVALGCPEKQLLRHDLCKLHLEQLEGYARYFRGGRREEDKAAYLAAWGQHQYEEHHHESYSKEGFNFDNFTEERLRNNMLESVADLLASTKQRGGATLIDWLLDHFPEKNPHPRMIPYFEEALIKAHTFYLENEENPIHSTPFKGLPCWNDEIAELFSQLKMRSYAF